MIDYGDNYQNEPEHRTKWYRCLNPDCQDEMTEEQLRHTPEDGDMCPHCGCELLEEI